MGYLGYKPADKPLTAADITDSIITSAKIVDGTIANADINSSAAIALSKLSTTGTASSANFLRGDGAWTAVSSDFVLLTTTNITSTTASVSFDGYFSSTYKNYMFIGSHLKNDTTGTLRMRYRQSNADVTSANYAYSLQSVRINAGVAADYGGGKSTTSVEINNAGYSSSTRSQNFQIYLLDPLNATYWKHYYGNCNAFYLTDYYYWNTIGGTFLGNENALSGITFFQTNGNFTDGTIKLYGIK
jgi:hypothetical protein